MSLDFFEFSKEDQAQWDEFIINSSFGSIHQISAWKNLQEKIPGRGQVLGFGVRENKKIKAVVLCVRMTTGLLNKFWWYSARGPVFDPQKDKKAGDLLITEVAQRLKKTGGMFWRTDPYFREFKFPVKTKTATQNYQPTDTLEIDLTKTDEEILAEMKRKGRYNINLARKKGVKIIAIPNGKFTAQDLDDFWKLNNQTTERDSFSGHEKSYYEKFLKELKDHAVLFFAELKHQKVATAISTFCGKKAIYYFGASSSAPELRNLMAPYLLQWEMIQAAKEKSCLTYDFLGIAPEGKTNHPYSGISEFKWKFGGERKTYMSGQEVIFKRFWYVLYRMMKKIK
ncbi:peptidoglycan bridge formation glycyltransferase FemA/FemB family protein [Candidatus Gracilibacteria bacterium]|nr:peptidoglycan bridge formation glycyltransferase FemA/FemB family protein [Candidatus Gracilibacteria bacterium]